MSQARFCLERKEKGSTRRDEFAGAICMLKRGLAADVSARRAGVVLQIFPSATSLHSPMRRGRLAARGGPLQPCHAGVVPAAIEMSEAFGRAGEKLKRQATCSGSRANALAGKTRRWLRAGAYSWRVG